MDLKRIRDRYELIACWLAKLKLQHLDLQYLVLQIMNSESPRPAALRTALYV